MSSQKKEPCADCPINNKEEIEGRIRSEIIAAHADPERPTSTRAIIQALPEWIKRKTHPMKVSRLIKKMRKEDPTVTMLQSQKSRGLDGKQRPLPTPADSCEWATPQWLFDVLDAEFHFVLDACASDSKSAKCEKFYSPAQDALKQDWAKDSGGKAIFCNPPYRFTEDLEGIGQWVLKAYNEAQQGAVVVMLLPVYVSRRWYRYIVMQFGEIRNTQGLVTFKGFGECEGRSAGSAFDVIAVIFRPGQTTSFNGPFIDKPGREAPEPIIVDPPAKRPLLKARHELGLPAKLNVVYGRALSGEVIARLAALYFQDGMTIADVTYGEGNFWTCLDMSKYNFLPSDNWQWQLIEGVMNIDYKALPYDDNSIDVVTFDPPFGRHSFHYYAKLYGTLRQKWLQPEVVEQYRQGMTEAHRVLRPGGLLIVKCKDCRESNHNYRTSHRVLEIGLRLGMIDEDDVQQISSCKRLGDPRPHKQKHLCKAQSVWWVLRKPKRQRTKNFG